MPRSFNPEVFYLQYGGEQRGPYTTSQIDHLVNSALVPEEALYWRDGMENWHPVTELVAVRRPPPRRWGRRAIITGAVVLVLLFIARLFGPIAIVGWRETAQSEFTPRAAYWRARDQVRHRAAAPGAVISFAPLEQCRVEMAPGGDGAKVLLRATLPGQPAAAWSVALAYDPRGKVWAGRTVEEARP